ncbi:MAG: hypothetical protein ACRETN_06505 [Nevskiales bacterium]
MNRKLIGLTLFLAAAAAYAASVPHTFQPNTPARAQEVNANFAALVTAVTSLENRVAALESGGPAPTVASLAGTYSYQSLEMGVQQLAGGSGHQGARVTGSRFAGTVTLNANGTFTVSTAGDDTVAQVDSFQVSAHLHTLPPPNSGSTGTTQTNATDAEVAVSRATDTDSGGGTWTLNAGEVVATSTGGEVTRLRPVAGKLLIGVNREFSTSGDIEDIYVLSILVKQ